jgi:hypothetical protein
MKPNKAARTPKGPEGGMYTPGRILLTFTVKSEGLPENLDAPLPYFLYHFSNDFSIFITIRCEHSPEHYHNTKNVENGRKRKYYLIKEFKNQEKDRPRETQAF